jgi:hypothetical protein
MVDPPVEETFLSNGRVQDDEVNVDLRHNHVQLLLHKIDVTSATRIASNQDLEVRKHGNT